MYKKIVILLHFMIVFTFSFVACGNVDEANIDYKELGGLDSISMNIIKETETVVIESEFELYEPEADGNEDVEKMDVKDDTSVLSQPSGESEIIAYVKKNSEINVIEKGDEYYKIVYYGRVGYVKKADLSDDIESESIVGGTANRIDNANTTDGVYNNLGTNNNSNTHVNDIPSENTQNANTQTPGNLVKPERPEVPNQPEISGDSEQQIQPEQPTQPEQPDSPEQPEQPNQPENPSEPEQLSED